MNTPPSGSLVFFNLHSSNVHGFSHDQSRTYFLPGERWGLSTWRIFVSGSVCVCF